MTSSSLLRFDIEDAPSEADVEVLPNGLEAFNERAGGRAISNAGRSPCSRASGRASSRGSRAKPTRAGSSFAGAGRAHKFTRANDFKDLSALSRNFFASDQPSLVAFTVLRFIKGLAISFRKIPRRQVCAHHGNHWRTQLVMKPALHDFELLSSRRARNPIDQSMIPGDPP